MVRSSFARPKYIVAVAIVAVIVTVGCIIVWRLWFTGDSLAATAPPAVVSPSYGVAAGGGLPYYSDAQLSAYMRGVKASGATWIRFDVDWSIIQPRNAQTYNWSKIDRVVAAANTQQLHILGIITYTPKWARASSCIGTYKCHPANAQAFAAFSGAVATHYGPMGVRDWEIWNEPNSKISWQPAANPYDYTQVLIKAYGAIHHVDARATVLSGGLARVGNTTGNYQAPNFLQAMYDSGAKGHFDAVATHPYSYPYLPTFSSAGNAWLLMNDVSFSVRSVMASHGDAYKKVWITEYGAPTNGPGRQAQFGNTNTEAGADHVTEALQAQIAGTAVDLYQADQSWTGPFFWDSYQDLSNDPKTVENAFGLLHVVGTQKPAYAVYKQAAAAAK
jgi:hypothetical protein